MSDTATPVASDPVRQFSVFIENRVGRLFDLVALLTAHNIHIMAMTTIDTTDTALDRFIVDDPQATRQLLREHEFAFTECEVLAVEFGDEQQLKHILGALLAVEVNIHYTYPFIVRPDGKYAIALSIEDLDLASQSLNSRGFKTLSQGDVSR